MYDVSQLLPRSPQSTRSRVTSTPTRQSPMRLASPTKSHPTPSRTRQMSPRKSPAKRSTFDTMSSKAVHFTPEKTRQPPRAWERRPATPYVSRDDKQKIWKRVPLGEIGIEPNRPVNISRRGQEAAKDYVRIVKKLKVGHGSDGEDKENMSLDAEPDCENGELKKRPHLDSHFVSMKMEDDDFTDSPKKKLRVVPGECIPSCTGDEHEKPPSPTEAKDDGGIHEGDYEDSEQEDAFARQNETKDEEMPVTDAVRVTDTAPQLNACTVYPASSIARPDASERKLDAVDAHGSHETSAHAMSEGTVGVKVTDVDVDVTPMEGSFNHASCILESELPPTPMRDEQESLHHSTKDNTSISTSTWENQNSDEMEVDHTELPTAAAVAREPRSSSPPTILAENVVIDELESRNVAQADASIANQPIPSMNAKKEDESERQEVQEQVPRRISDDEAAFLRNFVSNSKAERAAREKKAQNLLIEESTFQHNETSDKPTHLYEAFGGAPQITEDTPVLEPSITDSTENTTSSPLRRSKRAVITSIPRPQALPNAIQLKRANGNEFIFTANKACSAANVAVVTRSNTKRNKGSALNVPERLEQLLADDEAADEIDEVAQVDSDILDNLMTGDPSKELTTRKRKREAKDGAVRTKKILRWNDDKLVSYQEAKGFMDESEDIDDSSQETISPHEHETEESDSHLKLTLTLTSSGNGSSSSKSSSRDKQDNSSYTPQSKVRRVRRGTSGTVNGTPGPKTRSRRIANDENEDLNTDIPVDDDGSLEDSTAAAAAINELAVTAGTLQATTGTKRSRMPMPVASGLSTRRGAAASASVRSGSAATKVGAGAGAAGLGEPKKVKSQASAKDETKGGDLLGKRRLRVRS